MYNPEFDKKIDESVASGQISEDDRLRLHREARESGIDEEELDIVIDGRAYLKKHGLTYSDDLEVTEDTLTLTTDLDDEDEEESFVETMSTSEDEDEEEGFDFKKYLTLMRNNKVVRWLSIALLTLLCLPLLIALLVAIFGMFDHNGSSGSAIAPIDSITAVVDSIAPADTIRMLTDDEKLDSVRATLKGYQIVGVVTDHDEKHLVYYKGKTIYAYSTHQPDVAEVEMPYRITDVAINPKTSHINVITDTDPSDQIAEHYSMLVLYMVYFLETYNDDNDDVFCQLEWEEVGSAQAMEFVNKKTKIKLTSIVEQTFDADGNPEFITEDEITDLD